MVVRLTVSGRVQGVWFRASTREEALRIGLSGSVRNLSGGDVEIIAAGESGEVAQLIQWAQKGPPMAEVRDVKIEQLSVETPDQTQSFEVIG